MIPRIVITGAPASGKTTCFNRLQSEPAMSGFLFFEELARKILTETPHLRHHSDDFHRTIYELHVAREKAAGEKPFVTDRGSVDGFAFHPKSAAAVGTTIAREYSRYSSVIQLASAANLGADFYVGDEIRNESTARALEIEKALRKAWSGHPDYHFVPACRDFEDKFAQFKHTFELCLNTKGINFLRPDSS